MAGKLVQVATETVTSATASVTLTGIDSDDVYMVAFTDVAPASDNTNLSLRFTESGTVNTTTNYDTAFKLLKSNTSFGNQSYTNVNQGYLNLQVGNQSNETTSGVVYIYNANNSSEYTFFTNENSYTNVFTQLWGSQGGGVFTSASTVNGVNFLMTVGNIASGTFTLYKVV